MSVPSFDKKLGTYFGETCVLGSVGAFLSGGARAIPQGIIASFFVEGILHLCPKTQPYFDKTISPLLHRCSPFLKHQILEIKKKIQTQANAAIFGANVTLNVGSLAYLIFANNPEIYLARSGTTLEKVDLDKLDLLSCSPSEKTLLKCARFILSLKKRSSFSTRALTTVSAAYSFTAVLGNPRSTYSEITLLGLSSMALLAFGLKWVGWERRFNPSSTVSLAPSKRVQEREKADFDRFLLRQKGLGDLARLPLDLVFKIINELPEDCVESCATINAWWKAVCLHLKIQSKFLRPKFGDTLVDTMGPALARAPWHDLNTVLVRPLPHCRAEIWEYYFTVDNRYWSDLRGDRLTRAVNVREKHLTPGESIEPLTGYAQIHSILLSRTLGSSVFYQTAKASTHCPTVQTRDGFIAPTPFLYFINPEHLQANKIVKFKDAANRYGLAFQYRFTYSLPNGRKITAPGVAILHQMRPDKKEFVWIENQHPLQLDNDDGTIELVFPGRIKGIEGSSLRCFAFIYEGPKGFESQTSINLKWLQKFSAGKECGYLFFGKELLGQYPARLKLTANSQVPPWYASIQSYFQKLHKI